jgi:hypothetical protein
VVVCGLDESFAGLRSLPAMMTRFRAMRLLGGVASGPSSFESSSSAKLLAGRRAHLGYSSGEVEV